MNPPERTPVKLLIRGYRRGDRSCRRPLLAPEDAGWVGFDLAKELVDRAGLQVVIAMPSPIAVGPVQAPVMGLGAVA